MDFHAIENKYRPAPFWSWNEALEPEETRRQVRLMHDAGIGGFMMHARGGLQTAYMSEDWFDNIAAAIDEAEKLGMHAWAYDENGWPSGFGGGAVNGRGEAYQQKYLRMAPGEGGGPRFIGSAGGYSFSYEVNPFYVDTLDAEVTDCFLDTIYRPYYERFGNRFEGFFTDEPQISRSGIPWSLKLPEEYRAAYGEELLPALPGLFLEYGDYVNTRIRFWKLVTDLFSRNFLRRIHDWCAARGLKLTGHLVLEETLECQLTCNGATMPHYEYFDIPGMDWLGRPVFNCLTPLGVSSVAAQTGKRQVLSESFALCGHNVGHDELKGILESQMVRGITLLCPHLQGYSLRGIRKRDYPPAMYYQQPWWDDYSVFTTAMSRVGKYLGEGETRFDTLLLHPQTTAWALFDNGENQGLSQLNDQLLSAMAELDAKHVLYHLGDETMLERHGRVEGRALVVGVQRYTTVVLPPHRYLLASTQRLLAEFTAAGGRIVPPSGVAADDLVDSPAITRTSRQYADGTLHFFVNTSRETHAARIRRGGQRVDLITGDLLPFDGTYTFRPFDSLLVWDDGTPQARHVEAPASKPLPLDGLWDVVSCSPNVLTLDRCDYWFDGKLEEENGYVLDIQNRACALERPVQLRQRYTFYVRQLPAALQLACETPERFVITLNGTQLPLRDEGYFRDRSFRLLELTPMLRTGQNTLEFTCTFTQPERVYQNLRDGRVFESEKNKLTYDLEIEPVYLVGAFSLRAGGIYTALEKNAYRYHGGFSINSPMGKVSLTDFHRQGFPFFAGTVTLRKRFNLADADYVLSFQKEGWNVIRPRVNGTELPPMLWEPFRAELSSLLHPGENTVELTLTNNLRNMLGPHHLKSGECWYAGPHVFFREPCIWNGDRFDDWDDDWCFTTLSLQTCDR